MYDTISDLRIEKVRRAVEVTLTNGHRLHGDLFVPLVAPNRPGPGEPLDLLNEDDPFLPLVHAGADTYLVQKSQITVVATPLPVRDDAVERALVGMHVELTLVDGSTQLGSIFLEVRGSQDRLSDALNDVTLPFVAVFTAEQLRLVNRRHIAYVRSVT